MKNVFHILTDEEAKGILEWQTTLEEKVNAIAKLDDELFHEHGIMLTCRPSEGLTHIHTKAWQKLAELTRFRAFMGLAPRGQFEGVMNSLIGQSYGDIKLTRELIDAVNYELTWREGHYVERVAHQIETSIFRGSNWHYGDVLQMRPLKNTESFNSSEGRQRSDAKYLFNAMSLLETGELLEYKDENIYFASDFCQNGNIRLKLTPRGKAVLTELFEAFPYDGPRKAA